jgi:hypothetical protein
MIDLETLSTQPDAAILSAGVAIFNDSEVIDTCGWSLDLANVNGHIDPATLKWWMHEDRDAARPFSFRGTHKPFTFGYELKTFLAKHNPEEYWANDPEFDLVILRQWWRRQNAVATGEVPGLGEDPLGDRGYRKSRSYRTIIAECQRLGFDTSDLQGIYVAHDPVEDAASQARAVIKARQMIGGARR